MSDPKKTQRDLSLHEPAPSARTPYAKFGQERDTIRDLRPPFLIEREHDPPKPQPDPSRSAQAGSDTVPSNTPR